MIMFEYM